MSLTEPKVSDNPNAARATLSIGRKPLALAAFKAKIKLVEPPTSPILEVKGESGGNALPSAGGEPEPTAPSGPTNPTMVEATSCIENGLTVVAEPRCAPSSDAPASSVVRHTSSPDAHAGIEQYPAVGGDPSSPNAPAQIDVRVGNRDFPSPLEAPEKAARKPQPFTLIQGAVATTPPSWTDAKGRAAALSKWVRMISRDVGKAYSTKTERDAAEAFVLSHRLSIASAFHRRIVRGDVAAELARLFQLAFKSKDDDPFTR